MTIFEDAESIVNGDRQTDYGDPGDNHERTALLWNAYLAAKFMVGTRDGVDKGELPRIGVFLDKEDVCWLNVLQKIARQCNAKKRDNLVDSVGYIRNIEMMNG